MLEQYSKMGVTNDFYFIRNMLIFMRENVCLIIPTILLICLHKNESSFKRLLL